MRFIAPDPARYRISDDGKYLIEKIVCGDPPEAHYVLWEFRCQAGGFPTFDAAVESIVTREYVERPGYIEQIQQERR